MTLDISFIPYLPEKTRSRYEFEVLQAKARSHTARCYHRNKQNLVVNRRCPVPSVDQSRNGLNESPTRGARSDSVTSGSTSEHYATEADRESGSEDERSRGNSSTIEGEVATTSWSPSPWHWTQGTRVDPFNCITGSTQRGAAFAIDFRQSTFFCLASDVMLTGL
jgi:hypothetical protein